MSAGETKPPILKSISQFKNSSFIGWNLVISDTHNGFKYGVARIVSQYDSYPYLVVFNSSNLIDGDDKNGTYEVAFELPAGNFICRTQSFYLDTLELYDNGPVKITTDPLNSIRGNQNAILEIRNTCGGSAEYLAPKLKSITFNSSVEVGGFERPIEFKFVTTDGESGIMDIHTPMIYLSASNGDQFQIKSVLDFKDGTDNHYIARDQMPYGFGLDYIFVAIYGIVDKQNNYKSYLYDDLIGMGVSSQISRTFNKTIPVIERISPILISGGPLTISGKSLSFTGSTFVVRIDYQDGKGYQQTVASYTSSVSIRIPKVNRFTSNFIKVQIENDRVKSNEFIVYPIIPYGYTFTPTPTPTPTSTPPASLCPGTPVCNGRGECKENFGCQCRAPWYGPSCSSEIVIIPTPSPQPEPTTGTNITNGGDTISTMISILEVREIDDLENTVQKYMINQWNFTDLSATSLNPTYVYTSLLNQTTTTIETTISFFPNQTNITFGDQVLTMQQSSIKFAIRLSDYTFQLKTNSLQIIMESTIKGSSSDSCSSSQFGSQNYTKNNIQWIKMNIDKSSLYGRFIDYGIIDDTQTPIINRIIEEDTETKDTTQFRSIKVGITIPNYSKSVYLDPDFSNLIDVNTDDLDLTCKSKKKLSNGAIAGIVVGAVVFLALVIAATMYLHKRSKTRKEVKRIEQKLEKFK
ncbi:hypothetical protein PPL_02272 [Heterostelium album PN500]|uniref:EGF-like domain-containing protein n=1 Tax=Heterostelium pallidum (strain ATCC 26659 / Pp 5 / PN500) TaxID=670386 RepID=D3B1U8_HETP5|nr:hypothetical protein PPL_02272 [Heterostelium album PN500]EFA85272.1 hypothetical protein PPL_02272 [Heterostelium album PN500]|eukprot:XP_020437381.1 hypothetical protein PPL_02272 [Heterostelium album PN500]